MNIYSIHKLLWNYSIVYQPITFKKRNPFCVGHIVLPHSEETQVHFIYVLLYFEDEIMVFEIISPKHGVLVRVSSFPAAVVWDLAFLFGEMFC